MAVKFTDNSPEALALMQRNVRAAFAAVVNKNPLSSFPPPSPRFSGGQYFFKKEKKMKFFLKRYGVLCRNMV